MLGAARRVETRGIPPSDWPGAALHTPIGGTKIPVCGTVMTGLEAARRSFACPACEGPGRFTGAGF